MFGFGSSEGDSVFMNSSHHPYTSSIASSASSSSSSVFSVDCASSQTSVSSASSSSLHVVWGPEDTTSYVPSTNDPPGHATSSSNEKITKVASSSAVPAPNDIDSAVVPDLRQNPRRTKPAAQQHARRGNPTTACPRPIPSLVRQCDRKVNFVDNLVDSASQIVETIWPLSVVACRSDSTLGSKGVLPLRTFIQETLRRSRTSYSTLQVALYYLILIKPHVPRHDFTMEQPEDGQSLRAMQCGRRMFLAALILASKYLQDRNYSARAWSKISGLNTLEINMNEMTFLTAVNWRLHISETVFQRWTDIVLKYTPTTQPPPSPTSCPISSVPKLDWRSIIPKLTPELNDAAIGITSPPNTVLSLSSNTCPFSPQRSGGEPLKAIVTSNEQTPTQSCKISRVLESHPHRIHVVERQAPPPLRMDALPTPQITPRSTNNNTPAASVDEFSSRRPSMSAAMAQAQNVCMARTTLDRWELGSQQRCAANFETHPVLTRRSSLARSSSSASSPESMVSDVSSRSSRSSSISSVSSSICAPSQPRLAVQATRRCANLQLSGRREPPRNIAMAQFTEDLSCLEFTSSPESYPNSACPVQDFAEFSLRTPREMPAKSGCGDLYQAAARGLCELATNHQRVLPVPRPSANRKRGRDSADSSLQHTVRHLMSMQNRNEDDSTILPDSRTADSFLVPTEMGMKAVQSPSSARLCTQRLPLQKEMGRKRACCGEEAARSIQERTPGPGMWDGIL